jgi:hypothetical protein
MMVLVTNVKTTVKIKIFMIIYMNLRIELHVNHVIINYKNKINIIKMNKIYIVFGESGECSGTERWMVKAFKEKCNADLLAENAQKVANLLEIRANNDEINHWESE